MAFINTFSAAARPARSMRRRAAVCGALAVAALLACNSSMAGPAYTWNLSNDMRLDTLGTNPDNTWTYMTGPLASLHVPSSYVAMPTFKSPCDPTLPNLRCWLDANSDNVPSASIDDITESFSTLHMDAGVPSIHPGPSDAVIVRWTSPISGKIRVLGRFSDTDFVYGDGASWFIDRSASTLAQGHVQNTGAGDGNVFYQATSVKRGESLYFIVTPGPNGNYDSDSTQLDVLIAMQK